MFTRGSLVSGIICAVLLQSCASKPPKPVKPVETQAFISASQDVNTDSSGRASPVVLRVYQLRGDAEFNSADFFGLYDKDKEILAANLIMRDERTVLPGQQMDFKLSLAPETRFVGVMAAFRDFQSGHWKAITDVPPLAESRKKPAERHVSIRIEKDSINVSVSMHDL